MVDIVAGPELDAAVAKAIGLNAEILNGVCMVAHADLDDDAFSYRPRFENFEQQSFEPSIDLNVAWPAAIQAGLFSMHVVDRNSVYPADICRGDKGTVQAEGPTAAVAICAAILKLKGAA